MFSAAHLVSFESKFGGSALVAVSKVLHVQPCDIGGISD